MRRLLILIILLLVASQPAAAQLPPPIHVTVAGHDVTEADLGSLWGAYISAQAKIETRGVGKEARDAVFGIPTCAAVFDLAAGWIMASPSPQATSLQSPSPSEEENAEDCVVGAWGLSVLESGNGSPVWKAIYDATPPDAASRGALGLAIGVAFRAASVKRADYVTSEATWIQRHITPGMTRPGAYTLLRGQGLTAYNFRYRTGSASGNSCTYDPSSAAWPYAGELLPPQQGACSIMTGNLKNQTNPDATVTLEGGYNIACGSETRVTISFDTADRVNMVAVDGPNETCL